MEKLYRLSTRDKMAFNHFKGTVVHKEPLYVKYFSIGADGNPVQDTGYYFYQYDETSVHRIILPDIDQKVFECYTLAELGDLTIQEEKLHIGNETYSRYTFVTLEGISLPFFEALNRVEATVYRNYRFADNQSLWMGAGSALYVNQNGRQAYNPQTGRYMIGSVGISVELAAEYGMFDALGPALRIPRFETATAEMSALMAVFQEMQPLLWNLHRLGYAYTLYVYMETDSAADLKAAIPLSFYIVLDGEEPFRKRVYQDAELIEKEQIAPNDMVIRMQRANAIREKYIQFQQAGADTIKAQIIRAHVSYDADDNIVNDIPQIVVQTSAIDYQTGFEQRCFKALMRHFWHKKENE